MTQDIEKIRSITSLANTRTIGDELAFTYPEVINAIHQCTANQIAVLGVEIFQVKSGQYYASGSSTYDLQMSKWDNVSAKDWEQCVKENNLLAEESVCKNPTGDDHVYVLTTSSWREFRVIQETKRQ